MCSDASAAHDPVVLLPETSDQERNLGVSGLGWKAFKGTFCRPLCLGLSGTRFLSFKENENPADLVKMPCSTRKPFLAAHPVSHCHETLLPLWPLN